MDVTKFHSSEPSRMIWRQVQEASKGTQTMEAEMVLQKIGGGYRYQKKDVDWSDVGEKSSSLNFLNFWGDDFPMMNGGSANRFPNSTQPVKQERLNVPITVVLQCFRVNWAVKENLGWLFYIEDLYYPQYIGILNKPS